MVIDARLILSAAQRNDKIDTTYEDSFGDIYKETGFIEDINDTVVSIITLNGTRIRILIDNIITVKFM